MTCSVYLRSCLSLEPLKSSKMALYKSPRTVCCVFDCHSRISRKNRSDFFKFPSKKISANLLMRWVDAVKIPKKLTKDMTVCHRHFKDEDFSMEGGQRKLKSNAVPSQFLPKVWRNKFHPRDYGRMIKHMEVRGIGRLRLCFEAKLGRRLRKSQAGNKELQKPKLPGDKKQEPVKSSQGGETDEVTLIPTDSGSGNKKAGVPAPMPPISNDPFTSEIEIKEEPLSETEETIEDLLARMNGQSVEPKDKDSRIKDAHFELKRVCSGCGASIPCKCNSQQTNKVKRHQKLGELSCNTCMIAFPSMEKLREHNQALHEQQSFLCILCNESFKSKTGLMEHVAKHAVIRNFKCRVCTLYFPSKEDRDEHFRGHRIVRKEYTCRECKVVLKTRAACWDHLNVHIRGRLKSSGVPCEVCGRVLSTRITLKEHKLIHSGEKPYECQLCGRKIRHRSNFLLHVQGHTLGLPFQCTSCGMSFHKKSELNTHISIEHPEQKDYNCSICGLKFKTESRFIKHAMTHNAVLEE